MKALPLLVRLQAASEMIILEQIVVVSIPTHFFFFVEFNNLHSCHVFYHDQLAKVLLTMRESQVKHYTCCRNHHHLNRHQILSSTFTCKHIILLTIIQHIKNTFSLHGCPTVISFIHDEAYTVLMLFLLMTVMSFVP